MSFEGTIRSDGEVRHTIRNGTEVTQKVDHGKDECQAKLKGGNPGELKGGEGRRPWLGALTGASWIGWQAVRACAPQPARPVDVFRVSLLRRYDGNALLRLGAIGGNIGRIGVFFVQ
jgi:hypothetical protein